MIMQRKQLEDVFDFYGLSEVYYSNFEDVERHWLFKDVEPAILEDFFNSHDCQDLECCTLEEFCFSFMNFQSIHTQIPHIYYY
jgi:hypothetical protein